MSDIEEDIKALSDDLVADAERIAEIEGEKRHLDAGDPRTQELARETEQLVKEMHPKAAAEVELAEQVTEID